MTVWEAVVTFLAMLVLYYLWTRIRGNYRL